MVGSSEYAGQIDSLLWAFLQDLQDLKFIRGRIERRRGRERDAEDDLITLIPQLIGYFRGSSSLPILNENEMVGYISSHAGSGSEPAPSPKKSMVDSNDGIQCFKISIYQAALMVSSGLSIELVNDSFCGAVSDAVKRLKSNIAPSMQAKTHTLWDVFINCPLRSAIAVVCTEKPFNPQDPIAEFASACDYANADGFASCVPRSVEPLTYMGLKL